MDEISSNDTLGAVKLNKLIIFKLRHINKTYFVMVDGAQGAGGGHLDWAGTGAPLAWAPDHILKADLLSSVCDRVGVKEKRGQSHREGRAIRKVIIIILGEVDTLVCVPVSHRDV